MKTLPIILLMFVLAACNIASTNQIEQKTGNPAPASTLPDLGEAPELTNEIWLNTSEPLRLADLRGQVVLLEMWTFG